MKSTPKNYLNRELSWLEFNQRVLDLAALDEIPLLERVKFLAITGSNLDEFFKVRVGGLRLALENDVTRTEITGLSAAEELDQITTRVQQMNKMQSKVLLDSLLPRLEPHGIKRWQARDLDDQQQQTVEEIFDREIAAVVSPITLERGQPFPLLVGAKLCVCARVRFDASKSVGFVDPDSEQTRDRFVIVPIGNSLRRFVDLPQQSGYSFMLVEDIIGRCLQKMLPDQEILEWAPFRLTRNADIALNEDIMHDLLNEMTQMLYARKVSKIIRLEIPVDCSVEMLEFLQTATEAADQIVFRIDGPLDLAGFFDLATIPGFQELKDEPWSAQPSPDFTVGSDVFETIATADRILVHPYQQFDPVIDFLRSAAADPDVIAIKQTLYRTSRSSEVIEALIVAAGNGKQVTAIVELKARFDEERNIAGAKRLEHAGVDVIYGVQGLKTHAKICIVVRRESRGIQRYVHFGTGNYNESTARLYGDVSYFTNNEQLGSDAVMFFNAITGLSVPQHLRLLSAAPINLRDTLIEMVQAEIENARRGGNCAINAKINSLVDKDMIDALYEASSAGVKINLNIRGICCLRPGVKGLSENIKVVSIVDRFLEHSRIIHFSHGGDDLVYISSADWMGRNLSRRAELLTPIEDKNCRQKLLAVLQSYFKDNVRAKELLADGSYRPAPQDQNEPFRVQEYLYQQACDQYTAFSNPKATVFKAHRGESA